MPPPEKKEKKKPKPPRPKPPKPPKPTTSPEPKPPRPLPQRDVTVAGVPLPPDPVACANTCSDNCAFYNLCPPPPSPAATVHISSGRLPTPLIALSASLLAVSAVLLVALLVHRLLRRRRRRRALAAAQHGGDEEEGGDHQVLAGAVAEGTVGEEEEEEDGGVHHVWYIRTKGLDERAIAAIAAVVYDSGKKLSAAGGDGSCAVCLAEFRDGETLRLLPRCGHAFHRGCIDVWLRAHVNCPLCRAPVQVAAAAAVSATAAPGTEAEPETNLGPTGDPRRTDLADRAVRRAASMVALPRRAWPGVSSFRAPASSSGREEDMTGLGKIMRLLKFSDAVEVAGIGVGRSASFGAGSCQRAPARSGPLAAAGGSSDEMPQSTGG